MFQQTLRRWKSTYLTLNTTQGPGRWCSILNWQPQHPLLTWNAIMHTSNAWLRDHRVHICSMAIATAENVRAGFFGEGVSHYESRTDAILHTIQNNRTYGLGTSLFQLIHNILGPTDPSTRSRAYRMFPKRCQHPETSIGDFFLPLPNTHLSPFRCFTIWATAPKSGILGSTRIKQKVNLSSKFFSEFHHLDTEVRLGDRISSPRNFFFDYQQSENPQNFIIDVDDDSCILLGRHLHVGPLRAQSGSKESHCSVGTKQATCRGK